MTIFVVHCTDMKLAIYMRNPALEREERIVRLVAALEAGGCVITPVKTRGELLASDAGMLLAVGGDGTFLSAAELVADSGIPVLGVNAGRLGFLSENAPDAVAEAILSGKMSIEDRPVLKVSCDAIGDDVWPYAFNEVTVHRNGAAMLGVDVRLDGEQLPTYWADGLLVATSSGSTAYSLSVGGPIVIPESKVLIVSPIAPHNLNVRPLIIPDDMTVELDLQSRDASVTLTMDNRTVEVLPGAHVSIKVAQFSLKRVRLAKSDFIRALTEKLFWGEDVRNLL